MQRRKKTLIDKLFYSFVALTLLSVSMLPTFAVEKADCDNNAVMY